ncbi:MAG: hypothetical protein D6790_14350, partial [Caldilineae bacterium]
MTSSAPRRTRRVHLTTLIALLALGLAGFLAASVPSRAATPLLRLAVAQQHADGSIQVHVMAQEAADLAAWEFD